MKKIITICAAILITASVFLPQQAGAQAPENMSYQAVIRDGSNNLVTSTAVGMRIQILQGSEFGAAVYVETQTPTSNANGLVSLEIGAGTVVSGTFASIDWANGPYFIKTETDPAGGTSYTITGTSQLLSVPYALHAKTAETVDYSQITDTPKIPSDISQLTDNSNLLFDGNYNSLKNLPTLFDGNYNSLSNLPTLFSGSFTDLSNKPTTIAGYGITDAFSGNYTDLTNKPTNATTTTDGFMSSTDKTKLDSLQNANITAGKGISVTGTYPNFTINNKGATYRWATFSTYEQSVDWAFGNSSALFGGVNPSTWTDGFGIASEMSPDKEVLRTLFTQKGYATKNAMIMNKDWMSYSSTNGLVVMALFRVKNTTGSDINWSPSFYYSAYSGWGESASVALNGTSVMNASSSGSTTLTLTIPANRVSTVIFVSTSGVPTDGMRNCRLAFYNNSLLLPAGLEFVDDLDYATGGWEQ